MYGITSILTNVYALLFPKLMLGSLKMNWKQKDHSVPDNGLRHFDYQSRNSENLLAHPSLERSAECHRFAQPTQTAQAAIAELFAAVGYDIFVWTLLELDLAIMCASAPALKAFFDVYLVQPITNYTMNRASVRSTKSKRTARSTFDGKMSGEIGIPRFSSPKTPMSPPVET
ncbi:hypothetical protein P152DRAFT_449741 [Eremomyces bilateralis CBS 781.70]|uniref:Uncharacterized protein n=1 Tax=Eremomyces bilateralis CBS 781.70 TaxID=1392243 RepID=A0A6G1G1Z1_9PEZI|nr:uncharacterized protein P152DRAFT_449741 [Eremomyces bilateralis CBS 781.70]KAF1811941.1 hypothetical protein P152DRAFT_449741 [Eremomyces bilateralis CBS 781.70]